MTAWDRSAAVADRRLIDKARELGCDEDEAAFEKRLGKIAKAPQVDPHKKKPRRTGGPEPGLLGPYWGTW